MLHLILLNALNYIKYFWVCPTKESKRFGVLLIISSFHKKNNKFYHQEHFAVIPDYEVQILVEDFEDNRAAWKYQKAYQKEKMKKCMGWGDLNL